MSGTIASLDFFRRPVRNPVKPMNAKQEMDGPERFIDEALDGTFPASDPVSPTVRVGQPENATAPEPHSRLKNAETPGVPDRRAVTIDGVAVWDPRYGMFRIRLNDSAEFASVVVLSTAPLPLAHLSRDKAESRSPLGGALRDRIEYEVNAAIARGAHQVATGIMLMTHQEMESLR